MSNANGVSRLRDFQYRLEYALLRGLVALVRVLPLETATGLSASAWAFAAPKVARKRHLRALENVAIAFPEMGETEHKRIVMAHWRNLGRVMVETMQIDRLISDPDRIEIERPEVFARYKDKLGNAVGVSLHMGNWELAIWPLTITGANPAAVYRSVTNPYVDAFLRDQRRDLYPGGLFGRGNVEGDHQDAQRTARRITAFVRDGGRLGLICDLFDRRGIEVPFFGKPARTQAIGAMIARRTGARVWMARCLRIGESSRFRIQMIELKIPRSENMSADIQAAMADMQAQFEAWVRDAPEQWMWSNRRWS